MFTHFIVNICESAFQRYFCQKYPAFIDFVQITVPNVQSRFIKQIKHDMTWL